MTVVTAGTWDAARSRVDVALTAADLVLAGSAPALRLLSSARAPRHAVGVRRLLLPQQRSGRRAVPSCDRGSERVALLDVDAHHGNGAQSIFWERDDVLTGSVHVDPADGWFPHFLGFADESGPGTSTSPLPEGSGDDEWLAAVDLLVEAVRAHRQARPSSSRSASTRLATIPNSPLAVTENGFREAGRRVGALAPPTVVVQEGGYVLDTVGPLVRAALEGLEEGLPR